MENGQTTTIAGVAGAANSLVCGIPCSLLGLWFDMDGVDPSSFPLLVELVDEAATADITAGSKRLFRFRLLDPAGSFANVNLAVSATKGICAVLGACGTNDALLGVVWR